jgi:hypothetical protein
MVEFALMLPVLAVFLFAIVDFGMVFSGYETMRSGVAAGARLASVDQDALPSPPPTCTGGPGTGTPTTDMVCLIVARIGNTLGIQANSLAIGISLPIGTDEQGTASTWGQIGDNVEVCAQATLHSTTGITGVFLNSKTVTTSNTARIEQTFFVTGTSTTDYPYSSSSLPVTYKPPNSTKSTTVNGMTCT